MCKIDSWWEAAAWHRELGSVLCDDLEGWGGGVGGKGCMYTCSWFITQHFRAIVTRFYLWTNKIKQNKFFFLLQLHLFLSFLIPSLFFHTEHCIGNPNHSFLAYYSLTYIWRLTIHVVSQCLFSHSVSVFVPVPYCFDYYSFAEYFEIREHHTSIFVLHSQDFLAIQSLLLFYINFRIMFTISGM